MEKEVFSFFKQNLNLGRPVLLGYSGGPDSECLLQLLLKWQKVPIHLVHVDHGWRKESSQELEQIKNLAQKLKLPLHSTRLDPRGYQGNLEACSRHDRFGFFCQVAKETKAQCLLLGHHADDQAETVLKRVFEGASLPFLAGMLPVSSYDGLTVMRPLLDIRKHEILAWLQAHAKTFFEDPTNLDPKFLRAKMRTDIFPYLKKSFGKEFEGNLCAIAKEGEELRAYLERQLTPFLQQAVCSDWGTYHPQMPEEALLQRYLIKKLAPHFSRFEGERAIELLHSGVANKKIGSLYIDRGRAFFTDGAAATIESVAVLQAGSFGAWDILVNKRSGAIKNHFTDAWKGCLSTKLPQGAYTLRASRPSDRRQLANGATKEYGRYITEKKIPHFFTMIVPVIASGDLIVEDFLTGTPVTSREPYYQIELCRIVRKEGTS